MAMQYESEFDHLQVKCQYMAGQPIDFDITDERKRRTVGQVKQEMLGLLLARGIAIPYAHNRLTLRKIRPEECQGEGEDPVDLDDNNRFEECVSDDDLKFTLVPKSDSAIDSCVNLK